MSNLSDKEIDRLSREAADSFEPDHSSLSWSRLEQKLTEQMPELPPGGFRFGRINPYVWGPALVLLAGVSFYFIKNNIYSKHSTQTKQSVSKILPLTTTNNSKSGASGRSAVKANKKNRDLVSDKNEKVASDRNDAAKDEKNNAPAIDKSRTVSYRTNKTPGSDKKDFTHGSVMTTAHSTGRDIGSTTNSFSARENRNHKSSASKIRNEEVPGGSTPGVSPTAFGGNKTVMSVGSKKTPGSSAAVSNGNNTEAVQSSDKINSTVPPEVSNYPDAVHIVRPGFGLPSVATSGTGLGRISGNDSLMNKLAQSNGPAPHKTMHINRSLNIGLSFGPDYTDAGGITNNQIGNSIGITVGYYLTNKLSVNTGISYSNKFFWSPGHGTAQVSNFVGRYWVRTNAASPPVEFVNGAANIYELPLTLRYDFAKNEKTKFFVNAGFSSYFMLKQTYINFFHNAGVPVAIKIVDEDQQNYWFGVSDLSFGFETVIGKGFSFQAEPFFRLPLRDMGMENLKLNSYGFMLSFRYTPVLSRSRK